MTGHTLSLVSEFFDDEVTAECSCGWTGPTCCCIPSAARTFDHHIAAVVARTDETP